jgi:uncharacterized protein
MSLPAVVAAMVRPEFYPHPAPAVDLVQSHISYVLLAGDHVYKVKKSVRFSFLDFSTLERRRHYCHEEVRLNRRLAPNLYRGVVAICRDGSRFRLGPEDDAAAVEYAVHMRRLPAGCSLDVLLTRRQVTPEMIDRVAARLAAFHRDADAGPAVTANGAPAAVRRVLDDNYVNARRFRDVTVAAADDDAIQAFATAFLRDHDAVFRRRQAEHRIRECHGDLHTEHICFTDDLEIFDCIEFNPLFRYCDVASEIAFLAMDLDYHDEAALAARVVARYAHDAQDAELPWLVPFYQCYRAYVRGKVDSLKSAEEEVPAAERQAAHDSARRHFNLSYRYTWAYTRALVVVCGLSGTGKTVLAEALHARTGFVHINSDLMRKHLAGVLPLARPEPVAYDVGLYSPEMSARTYQAMLDDAAAHLAAGRGVVLDGTFQLRVGRDSARAIAAAAGVPFLVVECQCEEAEVARRLAERARRGDSPSDADWAVYREQRRRFEPFAPEEQDNLLTVDSASGIAPAVRRVEAAVRGRVRTS